MTEKQWRLLLSVLAGGETTEPPVAFIIDSPWLPGWFGASTLEYYTSDDLWFRANAEAVQKFPNVIFLPGFWSEYGMCTEPSAFGSRMIWSDREPPHAEKVIRIPEAIEELLLPDVTSAGLLPFVIQRLRTNQNRIRDLGHSVRFAVSRGPLNIASHLMGTTEFLTLLPTEPDRAHQLLELVTDFITRWLTHQRECFPTIDGILILDDMVGFIGDKDCRAFALPYLQRIFAAFPASVRFFHNDAHGLVCAPYLEGIGVNLFNFSFLHTTAEMRRQTGPNVTLLGGIPPREVLAQATPEEIRRAVRGDWVADDRRIVWSCGGGMPPGVPTENIRAFAAAVRERAEETLK